MDKWYPVTELPPISEDPDCIGKQGSGPVLVARRNGNICVARYENWVDTDHWRWITDDSEGWDITDSVTHWMKLPELPK